MSVSVEKGMRSELGVQGADALASEASAPGASGQRSDSEPGAARSASEMMPLPLVVFERYLLADDHAHHPMTFQLRLLFSGSLEEQAFERACTRALRQNALFGARVAGQGRERAWVAPPQWRPWIDAGPLGREFAYPGQERIAIDRESPTRIWVRSDADQVEVRLQVHHSSGDGLGAYQFLEDLLAAYDLECRGPQAGSRLRTVEPQRLLNRGRFGLDWWGQLRRLPAEIWGLVVGMFIFFAGRPVVLARRESEPPKEDGRCLLDMPAYHFTAAEFTGLKAAARRDGATLNDLLLCELFRAVERWQGLCRAPLGHKLVRVMMPVDLRTTGDERLPATNVVAMVNIDRRPTWIRNWRRGLRLIRWETWFLKRFRFGLSFIRGLAFCERLPGGLEAFSNLRRPYATAVLSNLGKVFEGPGLVRDQGKVTAGGLRLETVESAPPVRAGTTVGVSILSYAGRLGIVLSYDRWHWTRGDAQAFLEVYVDCLRAAGAAAMSETTPDPAAHG